MSAAEELVETSANVVSLVALDGEAFVWNADDWLALRKKHRVSGTLVGSLGMVAHQEQQMALPAALSPQETSLLLQRSLARLVECHSQVAHQSLLDLRSRSFLEQGKLMQKERRKKIMDMVDIIVEGKRRKLTAASKASKRRKLGPTTASQTGFPVEMPDRETILKEELEKVAPIPEESCLIQVPTECPFVEAVTEVDYPMPILPMDVLRAKTYSELWHQGFYLTPGHKFGADFLVYAGDPVQVHAQYLVICRLPDEAISPLSLISLSRVATSAHKLLILATMDESDEVDTVVLQTISWVS